MSWARANPSLAAVTALCSIWVLIGLASSPALPLGHYAWENGELSIAEHVDLVLLGLCLTLWLRVARRVRRAGRRLSGALAVAMALQLGVLFGEELDWGGQLVRLGIQERNLRMAMREVFLPEIMDSPTLAGYLLAFHLAPLVPLPALQSLLERAAPVRAERRDALAILAGGPMSVFVLLACGDDAFGMFHQQMVYVVLAVVTLRVDRRARAGPEDDPTGVCSSEPVTPTVSVSDADDRSGLRDAGSGTHPGEAPPSVEPGRR